MRREQSLSAPSSRDATEPAESLAALDEDGPLLERLTAHVQQARWAFSDERSTLAGTVNALLERLPAEVRPEEAAPVLHQLLGEGGLDGLEDLEGVPCGIVATRALLALGYPHALEVTPERLEALRRWERRSQAVPWGGLMAVLGTAGVIQTACATLGDPGIRQLFGVSADVLAGVPLVPTWTEQLMRFWRSAVDPLFLGQLGLHFAAFLLTMAIGAERKGRPVARKAFLGLGALGVLVGLGQLPFFGMIAVGTLVSAAGSLAAGWLLRDE